VAPGRRYSLGRAFEYRVRDSLKARGYFVLRSAGSKSVVDLVALHSGRTLLVQCKRDGELRVLEWNRLFDLARSCGAVPVLAAADVDRTVALYRLTGRKEGLKGAAQPMEPLVLAATEAA
jgi:Holliday junction resolvase